MSKIICYGCSNTFGLELDGVDVFGPPSKNCFASLIGALNLGIPGASNKQIMLNILQRDFESTDKVVIQWTYPKSRTLLVDDKGVQHQVFADYQYNNWTKMSLSDRQAIKHWQKYNIYRSDLDAMIEEYSFVKIADLHIKRCGGKILHMHTDEIMWTKFNESHLPRNLLTPMYDISKIMFIEGDQCPNGHPGHRGHQLTAKFIKRRLTKL